MISPRSGGVWGEAPAQGNQRAQANPTGFASLRCCLGVTVVVLSDSRTFQRRMSSRDSMELKLRRAKFLTIPINVFVGSRQ